MAMVIVSGMIFIIGMLFAIYILRKPTIIRFKISLIDWSTPVWLVFFLFTFMFLGEALLNEYVKVYLDSSNEYIWLIMKIFDGGVMVPVIGWLLSWIFGKMVEKYDLDLNFSYSERLVKTFFSVTILLHCLVFIIIIQKEYLLVEQQSLINRIVIWFITAIGIWISIGNNCKGRIQLFKENVEESKKIKNPERIEYYFAFWFFLGIISILYILGAVKYKLLEEILIKLRIGMFSFLFGFIIVMIPVMMITCPSQKSSDKRLKKVVKRINNDDNFFCKKGHYYRRERYKIIKGDGCYSVKIYGRDVIYDGNEEVKKVFGEEEVILKTVNFSEIREKIICAVDKREKYLEEQFKECKRKRIKSLERESI